MCKSKLLNTVIIVIMLLSILAVSASASSVIDINCGDYGEVTYEYVDTIVILTVNPDSGYVLSELNIIDRDGKAIEYEYKDNDLTDGKDEFQFRMPSRRVTVTAKFTKSEVYHSLNCDRGPYCPIWKYKDGDAYAWYHDGVHHLTGIEAVAGYSNGNYGPLDNATRSHVLVVLWRLQGSPIVNYLMTYSDVAQDDWYAEAVRWATSEDIVSGYGDGTFGPDDELTREQLAKILYNYNIAVGNVTEDTVVGGHIYTYEDIGTESTWADKALRWAMNNHLMVGDPGTGGKLYLNTKGTISRGLLAQLISRMTYM